MLNGISNSYPSDCGNSTFRDINVNNCAIGVNVGTKMGVLTLSDFYIVRCSKYGLEIQGTDNMFNNMNITSCLNGVYNPSGGSNKYSDMKVYWNGVLYHTDGTPYGISEYDYTTTFGMHICSSHNNFTNIEAQENYAHGIIFEGCYGNNLYGINADANGNGYVQIAGASQFGNGVRFINCHDFVGQIIADCYHTIPCQVNGITASPGCYNLSLDYAEYNQINAFNASILAWFDIRTPAMKALSVLPVFNWSSFIRGMSS